MSADRPEAAVEAAVDALHDIGMPYEVADAYTRTDVVHAVLTAALPHLATVKPDRDMIARAIEEADAETLDYERRLPDGGYLPHADAVLAADPRRTVASVKAEALREAAEAWDLAPGGVPKSWLRARADRIEAGGRDD